MLRATTQLDRTSARWIAVGVWVLGFVASALLLRSWVELEVDDSAGSATYKFENEPYALEFARLNPADRRA